jgi:nucleoside-diphosphate-sugar epimerase
MRVLVTGAPGFLGQYVVEQLVARGDAVRGLCRRDAPELSKLGVEIVRGDITDCAAVVEACRGMDAVVHTAAIAGIGVQWEPFYQTNVIGTRYVLDGCREHRVPRLVYTSSPSVTFAGSPQRNVDESVPYPTQWLAHYPHTKSMAEREVLAAHEPGRLHTCALRPHLIWGPRDRHLIPRLLDRAPKKMLKRVGGGHNLVDIIYVENAADAHLLALDRLAEPDPVGGKAYFLSQGEPVNCWSWIDEILSLAGLPPVGRSVPYPLARLAGGMLETIWRLTGRTDEPPMTRFLAAQLAQDHYFDLTRARNDLGYEPRISTFDGMRHLAEWMRSDSKAFPANH